MVSARVLVALAVSFVCVLCGQSTTTGVLQGIVLDSTGRGVPEATITLRQLSSSVTRTLTTGDAGQFQAAGLPIGSYSVHVEKSGFTPATVNAVSISVGQTAAQRITISPASVTERLEVQEQADALQTSATTASVALGGDRIEDAPAQNRNYLNFVLSAPGVSPSAGANTSRSMAGLRNPANDSGFIFNGLRGRNNSIAIDGVDNRDETTGGNRVAVGLEMVNEFRVSGTSYDVELGGAAGGAVNLVTRPGTNMWHGDVTYFTQNEFANARNPEADTAFVPRFRRYEP